jgi:hypothetical protein
VGFNVAVGVAKDSIPPELTFLHPRTHVLYPRTHVLTELLFLYPRTHVFAPIFYAFTCEPFHEILPLIFLFIRGGLCRGKLKLINSFESEIKESNKNGHRALDEDDRSCHTFFERR